MNSVAIRKVYIDQRIAGHNYTSFILSNLQDAATEIVTDVAAFRQALPQQSLSSGKRSLFLTRYEGQQVKLCPGTSKDYVCCNYYVVNEATNCPLECSYCILQAYLNNPLLTIYVNLEDMFGQIDALLDSQTDRIWRIGTGELTDSLVLDDITGLSTKLIQRYAGKGNVLLELKTKSANIDNLLKLPAANFVVSWSVNPAAVIASDEHKTATLAERLQAAKKIQEAGFLTGLHFDPVIYDEHWEDGYCQLIRDLRRYLNPDRIAWISIGSLRFPPALGDTIRERFPASAITYREQIRGIDGKMRYIKPLRLQMYQFIVNRLRQWSDELFIYFCMESTDVWEAVLDLSPKDSGEVDFLFAQSLVRRFPELQLTPPEASAYSDDREQPL
jgi:spore photoproduct lyase